ncbi:MAG: hypothetical protein ACK45U_09585 [bacterium]|jgi:hypothetical protein
MIEIVLKIVIFIGVVGVILGTMGWIMDTIQNKSISNLTVEDLNIPKTKFINMVNDWCDNNIRKSSRPKPSIEIKYHKNKKYDGIYYPTTNTIVVYVNNTNKVLELTNTIIHEYTHYNQNKKGFNKKYEQYNNDIGYWNNPYEIESRIESNKYKINCLKDILTNYNTK